LLTKLSILRYRNHTNAHFTFDKRVVLINGPNGSGKTNLIDAIYYICLCRSYFQRIDGLIMQTGSDFFRIDADFTHGGEANHVTAKVMEGKKKEFFLNGVLNDRLSDHIGQFPVVMVAPDDTRLIQQYAEERRRFLDTTISQLNRNYLIALQQYAKLMVQRNALLKTWQNQGRSNMQVMEVINGQLAHEGNLIFKARQEFMELLSPQVNAIYSLLSGGKEIPELTYQSDLLEKPMTDWLSQHVHAEVDAGKTLYGVHRDDIEFRLEGHLLKQAGSQGQIKSLLIALKLAPYMIPGRISGTQPILLLDDIFEKLDRNRLEALFNLLEDRHFSQVFITDADTARSSVFLRTFGIEFDHILINETIG
jgi:DNA replication and repair protein RecF